MAEKSQKINLTKSLESLNEIVQWFESQDDVDVETGLQKVREAAQLIKDSKKRLSEIDNEFREIEKEIAEEVEAPKVAVKQPSAPKAAVSSDDDEINPEDIPF